jgi:hypothetical protein
MLVDGSDLGEEGVLVSLDLLEHGDLPGRPRSDLADDPDDDGGAYARYYLIRIN